MVHAQKYMALKG